MDSQDRSTRLDRVGGGACVAGVCILAVLVAGVVAVGLGKFRPGWVDTTAGSALHLVGLVVLVAWIGVMTVSVFVATSPAAEPTPRRHRLRRNARIAWCATAAALLLPGIANAVLSLRWLGGIWLTATVTAPLAAYWALRYVRDVAEQRAKLGPAAAAFTAGVGLVLVPVVLFGTWATLSSLQFMGQWLGHDPENVARIDPGVLLDMNLRELFEAAVETRFRNMLSTTAQMTMGVFAVVSLAFAAVYTLSVWLLTAASLWWLGQRLRTSRQS